MAIWIFHKCLPFHYLNIPSLVRAIELPRVMPKYNIGLRRVFRAIFGVCCAATRKLHILPSLELASIVPLTDIFRFSQFVRVIGIPKQLPLHFVRISCA